MIVEKRVTGTPKNTTIEDNAYNFLLKLEQDKNKEYLVGIDYASLNCSDLSVLGYFTKDKEGKLVYEGYKILDE